MSGSDFEQAFGTTARPIGFAQRLGGKAEPAALTDQSGGNAVTVVGSGAYKPYGYMPAGTFNASCEIVRWIDGTDEFEGIEFPYRLLLEVTFSGDEQLRLHLPTCIVVIDGKQLRDLRRKLMRQQVTFMQQYSPKVWPNAKPQGEAIIEAIQVVRPPTQG